MGFNTGIPSRGNIGRGDFQTADAMAEKGLLDAAIANLVIETAGRNASVIR